MDRRLYPFLLILPAFIVVFATTIYPFLYTIYISFLKFETVESTVFVGARNYATILRDPYFWNSLKVTFLFVIGSVGAEFFIGFALASLLRGQFRGKSFYEICVLFPMVMTPVVSANVWRILYNTSNGFINWFLSQIGIPAVWWLSDPNIALFSIVLIDIWQWTPFVVLVIHAGLESLPPEPFEAASLDGASRWKVLRHITLPLMAPIILLVLVLRILDSLKTFDTIFATTRGGPGRSTETLNIYIFQKTFGQLEFGYGAALTLVMFIITFAVALVFINYLRRIRVK